jgi:hypothetical protein
MIAMGTPHFLHPHFLPTFLLTDHYAPGATRSRFDVVDYPKVEVRKQTQRMNLSKASPQKGTRSLASFVEWTSHLAIYTLAILDSSRQHAKWYLECNHPAIRRDSYRNRAFSFQT